MRSKYQQELEPLLYGSHLLDLPQVDLEETHFVRGRLVGCGKSTHLPNTITFSSTRILIQVWYHISQYNKQCKLAIHFAEHNFGPFGHIFFVIIVLEPEWKTLFIVLFSSLCLGIFIFYFGIYRIFIFLARRLKQRAV